MINVIGLGYIGLPTALMLAARGNQIVGTDLNKERVETLREGMIPFEEKGMTNLLKEAQANEIQFTTEYIETDMYIITVPTPYDPVTKKIDPSYIQTAVQTTLEKAVNGATIVVESTVSPGTMDCYILPLVEAAEEKSGNRYDLVHAPERILPGNMVYELQYNSRTVGCYNQQAGEKVKAVYQSFCEAEIVITDVKSAEMSKVVENTYRDINIAFANELAKIAAQDDLDVYEIIRIANKHPRVNILKPGPGVGGHCISVDPWFLVGSYPELTPLIKQARNINDSMPTLVLKKIHEVMQKEGITDTNRVGLYGLTYKANVDDTRESPALQLLAEQKLHLAPELKVYDPEVSDMDITENQYHDFEEFLEATEIVVIMVGHDHIKEHQTLLKNKIVIDTQNVLTQQSEKIYSLFR